MLLTFLAHRYSNFQIFEGGSIFNHIPQKKFVAAVRHAREPGENRHCFSRTMTVGLQGRLFLPGARGPRGRAREIALRKWFLGVWVVLCATSPALQAQTLWFTVSGNPQDESADTVQVDPVAFKKTGDGAVMNIRVNRARDRLNWDKLPYRSYEARVVFHCPAKKAEYASITYYLQPVWKGSSHNTTDYARDPRPMLFRDMVPNPTARIIQAACAAIADVSPAVAKPGQ